MARPLRIEFPGAVYRVTCRGNEQKAIFRDDADRLRFLAILSESASIYSIRLYCYVLMANHVHMLLETPLGNLGEFMRRFNVTYTGYFNRRHRRVGHLYQGRYKSLVVDKGAYLTIASRYIHLNPLWISSLKRKSADEKITYLKNYQWSSLPGYIDLKRKAAFIDYEVVLAEYGGDTRLGRKNYLNTLREDLAGTLDIKGEVIGQAILGGQDFAKWVAGEFLDKGKRDRVYAAFNTIGRSSTQEKIIASAEKVLGKRIDVIRSEGGLNRQIVMDVLSRIGGLKGREVGDYFGVDYSTVSVSRKRLREKIKKDHQLRKLMQRIETHCHQATGCCLNPVHAATSFRMSGKLK